MIMQKKKKNKRADIITTVVLNHRGIYPNGAHKAKKMQINALLQVEMLKKRISFP